MAGIIHNFELLLVLIPWVDLQSPLIDHNRLCTYRIELPQLRRVCSWFLDVVLVVFLSLWSSNSNVRIASFSVVM